MTRPTHPGPAAPTPAAATPATAETAEIPLARNFTKKGVQWLYPAALLLAAVGYLVNLRDALDFDLDEVMYTIAAQHVAAADSVSWADQPTAVHPPLHFLLAGAWMLFTDSARDATLDALLAARYLGALTSIFAIALLGLVVRRCTRNEWLVAAAMLLAAFDGFLVRFGRTALIEPTAVLAGLLVVYLALRLRHASSGVYIGFVGIASGAALLTKEPTLFTVLVPLLAALLERDWTFLRRAAGAAAVGGIIWTAFPLWAAANGAAAWWWSEHDTSLRRLAGTLQVSGLNRSGVSEAGVFGATFTAYAGGYLLFALGAAGLAALAYRGGLFHRRRLGSRYALLVAYGLLSYGFLAYCVLLGQANEQLTVYTALPSVLLTVLGFGNPMPRPAVAAAAFAGIVGLAAWGVTIVGSRDDATVRMGAYLTANYRCVPVNATGNAQRWAAALPRNHVESFSDAGSARRAGIRLYLLSPKDSRLRYGNSSPELDAFVRAYGEQVVAFASKRYERVELWSVPVSYPATRPCGNEPPEAALDASASGFLVIAGGLLSVVAACAAGAHLARRRP